MLGVSIRGLRSVISRSSAEEEEFQFTLWLANGGIEVIAEADMVSKIGLWSDDNSFRLTRSVARFGRLSSAISNTSGRCPAAVG